MRNIIEKLSKYDLPITKGECNDCDSSCDSCDKSCDSSCDSSKCDTCPDCDYDLCSSEKY